MSAILHHPFKGLRVRRCQSTAREQWRTQVVSLKYLWLQNSNLWPPRKGGGWIQKEVVELACHCLRYCWTQRWATLHCYITLHYITHRTLFWAGQTLVFATIRKQSMMQLESSANIYIHEVRHNMERSGYFLPFSIYNDINMDIF